MGSYVFADRNTAPQRSEVTRLASPSREASYSHRGLSDPDAFNSHLGDNTRSLAPPPDPCTSAPAGSQGMS